MSTLFKDEIIFTSKHPPNYNRSRILKSRENISKLKCKKSLKKKLKKYKLRKDGQEDPDIIDISQTLINTLRIKSPNNQETNSPKVCQETKPYNYNANMVRLQKNATDLESKPVSNQKCNGEILDESISLPPKTYIDKKQTDAFKLLMESRNKSIGTNSPGKVRCEEDSLEQDRTDKRELRAKRILSLNQMAQEKGLLKNLEIEEHRNRHIKRKMNDRAQRFKNMIVGVGGKNVKKDVVKSSIDKTAQISSDPNTSEINENRDLLDTNTHMFKTFDLIKEAKMNNDVKKITKEDEEFLKKLSPSIRKKENMLCYFQKVSKDSDEFHNDGNTSSMQEDQPIIKVKLKTGKKKKYKSCKITKLAQDLEQNSKNVNQVDIKDSNNMKKRKRNEKNDPGNTELRIHDNSSNNCHKDCRPKRNAKIPVKYADDFQLSSSDEELHIFTPKKKRKEKMLSDNSLKLSVDSIKDHSIVESCKKIEKVPKTKQKICVEIETKLKKNKDHKNAITRRVTKLAPIFVSKPILDSAAVEAKQKFLQSGVPSQLKKTLNHQNNILASEEFQKVEHIQQLSNVKAPMIMNNLTNAITADSAEDIHLEESVNLFYKKLLQVPVLENHNKPKFQKDVSHILQNIKQTFPKFPVYRTYHLLRGKSKGEFKDCIYPDLDNSVEIINNIVDLHNVQPDKLNWADKYKPTTEKQVIGNFESIRELRRWLVTWTENDAKSKKSKCSSDSDFYQSDTDSREKMRNENNLLIITGKVGTGKTLSVYAVAAELAIKVIEVNASTKRTGKVMLQDLQEATKSHKVDRGKSNTDPVQKQETSINVQPIVKKRGRKKKVKVEESVITKKDCIELTVSQENMRTGMSLILIDDADIVFEQDDGFCFAISQLIQSSKRPVILVTSSLSCPHLQKFSSLAKIIKMRPFLPRMLGTWLDIMCLVDNNTCSPGLGAKILDLYRGDIRRTINYLQFYTASHKHLSNSNSVVLNNDEVLKVNIDDENSCMSWGDNEGWGDKNVGTSNNGVCQYQMDKESQSLHIVSSFNTFYFWWNLPNLLNNNHKIENLDKVNKTEEIKKLNQISAVLDDMSISDYLGTMNEGPNITSGPWQSFETDSVIDNENFASYNRNKDRINDISLELIIKSTAEVQRSHCTDNKTEMNYPTMSIQRERDRVVSRHRTLTRCLNPSTVLDRRALALDYWSSCRTICRTEKSKPNTNSKRNNRFCHYLKCLNIVCRNEYFDNLGESLIFKK